MEKLSALTGKYGEEGDQLLFKILKEAKFDHAFSLLKLKVMFRPFFSEEALRYDLTVPFARYVVQHQNEIHFPFKRYQIQPVWKLTVLRGIGNFINAIQMLLVQVL